MSGKLIRNCLNPSVSSWGDLVSFPFLLLRSAFVLLINLFPDSNMWKRPTLTKGNGLPFCTHGSALPWKMDAWACSPPLSFCFSWIYQRWNQRIAKYPWKNFWVLVQRTNPTECSGTDVHQIRLLGNVFHWNRKNLLVNKWCLKLTLQSAIHISLNIYGIPNSRQSRIKL